MRKLYSFHWDCGRAGDLQGLFIADENEVQSIIGRHIYFGEVLGKHSEVEGTIEEGEIIAKTDDQDFIDKLIEYVGDGTISGHNPLDYLEDDGEEG